MMASGDDVGISVTHLLHAVRDGQGEALEPLIQGVYAELQAIAARCLRQERADHTLRTTDLVHEAYFKLVDGKELAWDGRAHFFGAAARAMRQVLVDYARARSRQKRGGDWRRTTLSGQDPAVSLSFGDLLSLDDALDRLDDRSPRLRQVVEMRFFGGMTEEEVADVLDVTPRTVQRDWVKARAWLYKELHRADG
jgi:RNA polymerase sigma factor (TIGR02999 family)